MDRLIGPPPIRIVHEATKVGDEKVDTVTIKVNGGTKHSTPKFSGGAADKSVCFIHSFWTLGVKLEYHKDYAFTKTVRTAQKVALSGLDQNQAYFVT